MDVVVFCGGRGTRLSEKTDKIPKPLVEIGDNPVMWHIMKSLSHYGNKRFILTLGYKGDLIKRWFVNHRFKGSFELDFDNPQLPNHSEKWSVLFKNTGLEAGTGSRLNQVKNDIKTDTFIVAYGDVVSDVNVGELLNHHKYMVDKHKVLATVTGFQPRSKYGIINHDNNQLVTSFTEKPKIDEWVNIGYMVCEKQVLNYLNDDINSMFENDALHDLAGEGKLALFKHDGVFYPMDTFKDYVELNQRWDSGNARWKVWKD